jgi:hypothetical protein
MPIPEGYGEATFVFSVAGDPENMTFSMGFKGASGSVADLTQAFTDLVAEFTSNVIPTAGDLLEGWTWVSVEGILNPTGLPNVELVVPKNVAGTNVASSPPPNVTLLIAKRSNLAGRANRGRVFLPPYGLDETDVDQTGTIDGAAVALIQTKWTGWIDDFGFATAGNEMVILHASALEAPTEMTEFLVRSKVATQRRRLR